MKRVGMLALASVMSVGMMTAALGHAAALKVAMVVAGALGDRSFYDSANDGLTRAAQELGAETKIFECRSEPSAFSTQIIAAAQGSDVVFTVGWELVDSLLEVAPTFPRVKFIQIDAAIEGVANVSSIDYLENEGAFAAGALAAMMTAKTGDPKLNSKKIIGAIGGMDIPSARNFMAGFEAGAKYVNPDVTVETGFVGSFEDPARGKEIALTMFNNGADILFQCAGRSGSGVIAAAKEVGFYVISAESDDRQIASGFVIGGMIKRVGVSIFETIQHIQNGSYQNGVILTCGIAQHGVGLSHDDDLTRIVGEEVMNKLHEIEQSIAQKTIPVPAGN